MTLGKFWLDGLIKFGPVIFRVFPIDQGYRHVLSPVPESEQHGTCHQVPKAEASILPLRLA